jgi:hypothetical protein
MSVGDSIELEGHVGAYKVGNLVKVTQPTIDPDALYIIGQVTALDVTGTYEESMTIEVVDFRWSAYGNSIAGGAGRYEVSLCSAPVYGYGFELPPTSASMSSQYFSGLVGTTLNLFGIIGAYKIDDKVKITGWDMGNYGTLATGAYILGTITNLYRTHSTDEGVGILVEETFANGFDGIYPVYLNIAGNSGADGASGSDGLGYYGITANSATSIAGTAGNTYVFTSANTGAFALGNNVKVNGASGYIIGEITALTQDTGFTVYSASEAGEGSFSSASVSLAGLQGNTGATGPTGPNMAISDTPPVSPAAGQLWFESDTGLTYIYYDASWVEIGAGSSYDTVINTIQAKGDLLAGTASQALGRLTVGANSQRLVADSFATTGLAWANDSTNTIIDTKGDLLVGATNDVVARLPVGTDNQTLVADSTATNGVSWMTSITKGGHSNIYSNSASITSATIVSASRTYNNRQYLFSNLTFNMPTNANTDVTDWTAPANSSTYKWSYIYIRPSDNKFFLSNTAPAAGLNYRTIGGSVCLYLFPAYTSTINILNFQLDNSKYSCDQPYNARTGYRTFDTGIQLNYDWGSGNRTTTTADVTAAIPTSATELYIGFRNAYGWRDDSGNTREYYVSMEVQNKSGTWSTVHVDDGFMYCKTPSSGGGYYLRTVHRPVELTLSTNTYNFAATRMTWSHSCTTGDADTGAGFWLKGFNDGNIF